MSSNRAARPDRPDGARPAPVPIGEAARLADLYGLGILDTPAEESYDAITRTAAYVAGAPIALVTLIDEKRQWIKSCVGLDLHETARDDAFCAHAILTPREPFIVEDALADPRFRENPYVVGPPGIRFYCGIPLVTAGGSPLGALCVIDIEPRTIERPQIEILQGLADQVVELMQTRAHVRQLESQALRDDEAHTRVLRGVAAILRDANALEDALERTLALLVEALGLSAGGLWWRAGDRLSTQALWIDPSGAFEGLRHAREGVAYPTEVLIHADDAPTRHGVEVLPSVISAVLLPQGIDASYAVPIVADGEVAGALELIPQSGRPPTGRQLMAMMQACAEVGRWLERDEASHWIREATSRDVLTGLLNRRSVVAQVEHLLAGTGGVGDSPHGVGLLLVGVNDFVAIAAALDADEVDELILAVVALMQRTLPPGTRLARHGEESLLAILDGADDQRAVAETAAAIHAALEQPIVVGARLVPVTASIGIAHAPYGTDARDLLTNAEQALVDARRAGFATTVGGVARPVEIRRRLALRMRLEDAVDDGDISVVYQPLLRLATGEIVASEALARWTDAAFGEVPPDEFIALAEAGSAIEAIGTFVRDRALRDLGALSTGSSTPDAYGVWVNVSVRELDARFAARVSGELAAAGIAPSRLTLEVTERMALDVNAASIAVLEDLAALGVQIAVDDFGTGFTSLTQLRHLPLSRIKIDRSFTSDLIGPEGARVQPIVGGIVQLGHALGLEIVVEGIETAEQLALARELGADLAQGHHIGMPAPLR